MKLDDRKATIVQQLYISELVGIAAGGRKLVFYGNANQRMKKKTTEM